MSGKANIEIVRDLFGRGPEEEEFTTVGGFLASRLGPHPAARARRYAESDLRFTVEEADRRRVYRVKIEPSRLRLRPSALGRTTDPPAESRTLRPTLEDRRPVAVVGRPNAGKSTLVNALVGEKVAIVSDKPQTTRKRILGVARRPGAEIALVDTPGIHRPEYRMNAAMVRDATDALSSADLVLFVVDAAGERGPGERFIARSRRAGGRAGRARARTRSTGFARRTLLPLIAELTAAPRLRRGRARSRRGPARTWSSSSRSSRRACRRARPAYPEDFLTATPETEWIGEVIREKLLERTRDELPFAHAVLIESVREAEGKDITVVTASIVVEREGQKGIVVGKGGTMIRDIGQGRPRGARAELGRRLYLELTVRVKPDWRNDERFLSQLRGVSGGQ